MRFELRPWRKPMFAEDGLVLPIGGISLILGLLLGLLAPSLLRWSAPLAWGAAIAVTLVPCAAAWALGHRAHGPGSIVFADGRITIDLGRGRPCVAPIGRLRSAMRSHRQGVEVLHLRFEGDLIERTVRTDRLVDPVEDLLVALRYHVSQHGDLTAFDQASERQAALLQWTIWILLAVAVSVGLWSIFIG